MAKKERFDVWLEPKNKLLLRQTAKKNNINMSQLINALIEQKLADPIKVLKEKKKLLIIEINKLDDQIKHLEKLKDE